MNTLHPVTDVDHTHRAMVEETEVEMTSSDTALFWSALGGGLGISLSFIGAAAARAAAPPEWRDVAGALGYPIGFVLVVTGGYHLFTEHTLAPVARLFERLVHLKTLLRMWGLVLLGNALGAIIVGAFLALPGVLPEAVALQTDAVMSVVHPHPPLVVFARAAIAGWLVASMVWLLQRRPETPAILIIWVFTALMPLLTLEHVVVGTVEATYAALLGQRSLAGLAWHLLVTLAGNTVGGVAIVTLINHARTKPAEPEQQLTWRETLFGSE